MESVFRVNMISTSEVLLDWTKTVMVSFADFLLLKVHSRIRIIWICSYFLLLRAGRQSFYFQLSYTFSYLF